MRRTTILVDRKWRAALPLDRSQRLGWNGSSKLCEAAPMISDPIEFELFKNALFGIADEMALTVFRTTYSGVLKIGRASCRERV